MKLSYDAIRHGTALKNAIGRVKASRQLAVGPDMVAHFERQIDALTEIGELAALAQQAQPLTDRPFIIGDEDRTLLEIAARNFSAKMDDGFFGALVNEVENIAEKWARDRMAQQGQPRQASQICSRHQHPNEGERDYDPSCNICWGQQAQPLTDEMIEERANHLSGEGEFANGTERTRYKHGAKWARDFRAPMPTPNAILDAKLAKHHSEPAWNRGFIAGVLADRALFYAESIIHPCPDEYADD